MIRICHKKLFFFPVRLLNGFIHPIGKLVHRNKTAQPQNNKHNQNTERDGEVSKTRFLFEIRKIGHRKRLKV